MNLNELLSVRLVKKKSLDQVEYDELGLYGEGLCELDEDDDCYDDEDEEIF